MQLVHLVERIPRNFGEMRLTGAVFLDVAKAFDTVWIECLLYKITLLDFPPYIVHTISSYLRVGRSKRPSRQPCHPVEAYGLWWLRVDLSPLTSSVCMSTT